METRILGGDLEVSAVGLGCMGMSHAYGAPADREDMRNLIAEAVDLGVRFFDTAELYGNKDEPNANEELLGELLAPYRDKIVIGTKFGVRFDYDSSETNLPVIPDARPEVIRKSVEGSLRRLRTDHIDLYCQHRRDPSVPVEEVAGVMADLIREGKITHWGLSETDGDTLRRAHAVCPVTAVQNRYSMMARWHEALFPVLEELNVGFVAFSPMANGLLSGKYDAHSVFEKGTDYRSVMPQFTAEGFAKNQALLELVRRMADDKKATPAQIALAWMLRKKPYVAPIPGTRKPERLRENAGAADVKLTKEEVSAIDAALDNMEMSAVYGGAPIEKKERARK